mgnify:CR=1 FL=1
MIFFRKPTIKAKLVKGGTKVKVSLINANKEQTMTLLFLQMKQIAAYMKMEPRALMNKVIDLDKTIVKSQKLEQKAVKYKK